VGASIEDATGVKDNPIYNFDLSVERIKAAVEAKNTFDFPFMLTARAENFVHGLNDLKDTIKRLQVYQEAGADVLYAPDLKDYKDIVTVIRSLNKPLNVMIGSSFTVSGLNEIGVKRISLGSLLARSAIGEMIRSAKEIKEKGTCTFADNAYPFMELMNVFK
jgi:2-methylisocitrate lyase-like PEP mutase family enzyme